VLAWSLWVLWLVSVLLVLWLVSGQTDAADSRTAVAMAGYVTVGSLVASREPGNAVGWLLLATGLTFSLQMVGEAYAARADPGYVAVAWVTGWLFNVWFVLVVVFLPLLFPDGHVLSPRWRPAWWLAVAALVSSVAVTGLLPGRLGVNAPVTNPLGVSGAAAREVVDTAERITWVLVLVAMVTAAASLVLRFRRSAGPARLQLKWFAFAGGLCVGGLFLSALSSLLPGGASSRLNDLGWAVFITTALLGIPMAIGIAILRHRLYDIDVVINRTLVYGTLTATLVITYVGSVLVLRLVLSPVTGESPLAIAASTLAVAALFRPARTRIQKLVDRRFYRRKYDAAHTLDTFAAQLRHELDLDAVANDLRTAVNDTVQPTRVSLWLREATR
jgi:hypothetical protein